MNLISAQRFHDFTVDHANERAVLRFAEAGGSLAALEVAYAEMKHVITHLIHYYANAQQKADAGQVERHGTWAEFPCWVPQSVHMLDSFPKVILVFDLHSPSQLAYGFSSKDARNLAMMLSKAADDVDAKAGASMHKDGASFTRPVDSEPERPVSGFDRTLIFTRAGGRDADCRRDDGRINSTVQAR